MKRRHVRRSVSQERPPPHVVGLYFGDVSVDADAVESDGRHPRVVLQRRKQFTEAPRGLLRIIVQVHREEIAVGYSFAVCTEVRDRNGLDTVSLEQVAPVGVEIRFGTGFEPAPRFLMAGDDDVVQRRGTVT